MWVVLSSLASHTPARVWKVRLVFSHPHSLKMELNRERLIGWALAIYRRYHLTHLAILSTINDDAKVTLAHYQQTKSGPPTREGEGGLADPQPPTGATPPELPPSGYGPGCMYHTPRKLNPRKFVHTKNLATANLSPWKFNPQISWPRKFVHLWCIKNKVHRAKRQFKVSVQSRWIKKYYTRSIVTEVRAHPARCWQFIFYIVNQSYTQLPWSTYTVHESTLSWRRRFRVETSIIIAVCKIDWWYKK